MNEQALFFREDLMPLQYENAIFKLNQTEQHNNEEILTLQAQCQRLKDETNQLTNDL